ncbi:MAG: formylmethanofuran dehydrogenase subunit E family protein [Clostridia bacterium]|nr:formylmethanofuran dehydrogenase subunit E family protein [Clostridia bacterium]
MRLRKDEILDRIARDEIDPIQERVKVVFDNRRQSPLGFYHRGRYIPVQEVLDVTEAYPGYHHFLVLADQGIYNLVLVREAPGSPISPSHWILNFQVQGGIAQEQAPPSSRSDRSASYAGNWWQLGGMLVPADLLGLAYFHGHLCPDLALGYRAVKIAEKRLGFNRRQAFMQTVRVSPNSPAVDAVQYLTGCTIGKGNLIVEDGREQSYCFINPLGQICLVARQEALAKSLVMVDLEAKLCRDHIRETELYQYQFELNQLIERILQVPDGFLFKEKSSVINITSH